MPARKTYEQPRSGQKKTQPVRKKPVKGKQGHWLWLWMGFTGVAMLSA
ncbi:MAG TPA: LytR family transcriptional regulator, partial [Cyanobacteria bacterium UBA11162]|nr:LytR family transcriptional regulator [Cyanobacteria bacterium UBA11162]